MDNMIAVNTKGDEELAHETLLIKRLRAACAVLVKAEEDRLPPRMPRERPRRLSSIQREFFQQTLNLYVEAEGSEAFVLEMEQRAMKAQG
jgi:hypothetical protein